MKKWVTGRAASRLQFTFGGNSRIALGHGLPCTTSSLFPERREHVLVREANLIVLAGG